VGKHLVDLVRIVGAAVFAALVCAGLGVVLIDKGKPTGEALTYVLACMGGGLIVMYACFELVKWMFGNDR
jgi:hypothetical protein